MPLGRTCKGCWYLPFARLASSFQPCASILVSLGQDHVQGWASLRWNMSKRWQL